MSSAFDFSPLLSPELQLICLCCRTALGDPDREAILVLLGQVDADTFAALAIERHRVGPLVYEALKSMGPQILAGARGDLFAAAARANALPTLRAQRAHVMLDTWLADAGIDSMPFKGLTVAQRFYPRPECRHVLDLDVWVPPAQLDRARQVLLSKGFHLLAGEPHQALLRRGPRHRAFLASYYHEEQYTHAELGKVELHWKLSGNQAQFGITPEQMRARGQEMRFGRRTVRVMDDVDLLLYLCEHGSRHGWGRLKWLVDLPRILNSREWDWTEVFSKAAGAGCLKTLALGLVLSRDLLGWQPPEAVARELGALRGLRLAACGMRYYLRLRDDVGAPTLREHIVFVFMQSAKTVLLSTSLMSTLQHLRRYALSPDDLHLIRLPDSLFSVYYLLRPLLFVTRRIRTSLGRVAG